MAKKHGSVGSVNGLKHGRNSKQIQELKQKLQLEPLKEVQKYEFDSYIESLSYRAKALEADSYINQYLGQRLKDFSGDLLSEEADLIRIQAQLADQEQTLMFHKQVKNDLKNKYLKEVDLHEQKKLLEMIDEREKTILMMESKITKALELKSRIRADIGKKEYNKAALKMKAKQFDVKENIIDVDMSALDDVA